MFQTSQEFTQSVSDPDFILKRLSVQPYLPAFSSPSPSFTLFCLSLSSSSSPLSLFLSSSPSPAFPFSVLHFLFDSNVLVKACVAACLSTKLVLVILVSVNLLSYQLSKAARESSGREKLGSISNSPWKRFVNKSVIYLQFYCTDMSTNPAEKRQI